MNPVQVTILNAFSDNYVYMLTSEDSNDVLAIDPGDASPVLQWLEQTGRHLTTILSTHHHNDHTEGNLILKDRFQCEIVGPSYDADRIPGIDRQIDEESGFSFAGEKAHVFHTPGHTRGHISVHFPQSGALFAGDTLFVAGCGRLFEGDAATMHQSLLKFTDIPDETKLYCGHEYTLTNLNFALTVEPDNADLQAFLRECQSKRNLGVPTIPSTMGMERKVNPFLRIGMPELRKALALENASDVDVFAHIRERRNQF